MKAIVSVSQRGVISLPAKLRRAAGIQPEDQLVAETTPDGILLRPAVTLPVEIYTEERLREFKTEEQALQRVLRRKIRE